MTLHSMNCCACQELICLDKGKPLSGEKQMREFCNFLYSDYSKRLSDPGAFVIFTGVVKVRKGSDDDVDDTTYGPTFASYIKEQKLGSIKESVKVINRTNHPDHWVKVWVWAPNFEKLKAWYKDHK